MKAYAIIDITDVPTFVCEGDTRKEAIDNLAPLAVLGNVYTEVKTLGMKITPKERKSTYLSRIKDDGSVAPVEAEAEDTEE